MLTPRRRPNVPAIVQQVLYAGPTVPTAYDPKWQLFTNLTKDQIKAFQSFPEWAAKLAALKAHK